MPWCLKHTRPHIQIKTNHASMPLSSPGTQNVPAAGFQVWTSDVVSLWCVGGVFLVSLVFHRLQQTFRDNLLPSWIQTQAVWGELKGGTTHSIPSCQLAFRTKMYASRPLEQSRPRCDPMQTSSVDQTPLTVDSNQPCTSPAQRNHDDWFLPSSRLISSREIRGGLSDRDVSSFHVCNAEWNHVTNPQQNGPTWHPSSIWWERCPLTVSNSVPLNKEVHYVDNKGLCVRPIDHDRFIQRW